MTTDTDLGSDDSGAPDRACALCGHAESDHEERDTELAGYTVRRFFCLGCDDWCEFEPID